MRKTFRLGFVDYGMNPQWITDVLAQKYDVIRDDANPNILIFGDENFGNRNEQYDHTRVFKVFMTGENRRFWNYKCHAGITFDHIDEPVHYRLPLYIHEMFSMTVEQGMPGFDKLSEPREKTGFASFVVGNPHSEPRNRLFYLINNYKKVDSAGPHLNNIGHVIDRSTAAKIEFLRSRKFHLAFENSSYAGYVTEKILHGFYARTVPIYWGSTTLSEDFNPKAVINWHDYRDDKKFLERIIEVDNNDDLYYDMLNQPMLTDNRPNKYMNMDLFLTWWENNIMGKIAI